MTRHINPLCEVIAIANTDPENLALDCEEPLTASLEDTDRMVEARRSRSIHFAAGLVISSYPDYQKVYELVTAGEIGKIQRIDLYGVNNQARKIFWVGNGI